MAIARLTHALEDQLARRECRHGVLLDVLGLGVLLTSFPLAYALGFLTWRQVFVGLAAASLAVTVSTAVVFSGTLTIALDVIDGVRAAFAA